MSDVTSETEQATREERAGSVSHAALMKAYLAFPAAFIALYETFGCFAARNTFMGVVLSGAFGVLLAVGIDGFIMRNNLLRRSN